MEEICRIVTIVEETQEVVHTQYVFSQVEAIEFIQDISATMDVHNVVYLIECIIKMVA